MVIFVFLGRATDTLIPAVALPLSLLLTFIAMKMLGYSLDNLSLMALTLAIGFLVDDAIVFLENTVRLMETGQSAFEASLNSAKEISFTILAMTISLAAVFIPLVFMSGLVGRIFREFSITIVDLDSRQRHRLADADAADDARACSATAARAPRRRGWSACFGGIEHRVLDVYGRSLWFFLRHRWVSARDLGRLPGRHGLSLLRRSQGIPAGRRQLLHPRRHGRAGRILARPDARLSDAGGEDHERESRRAQHLHHERERGSSLARTRGFCWRS